jgi:hypothetical protein
MTLLDREQLARVLGMLGSDHDGEVAAAGRQAERLRRQAEMTWHEILSPPAAPRQLSRKQLGVLDRLARAIVAQRGTAA